MQRLTEYVKTAVIGGFFVLLPAALVMFLVGETITTLVKVISPAADLLPVQRIGGVGVALIAVVVALVALCFVTGVAIQTRFGARSSQWFEGRILARVPGYDIIKRVTGQFTAADPRAVVLVDLYGSGVLTMGMIVEEHPNGYVAVFVPMAPTPTVGAVYYLPAARTRHIATSSVKAVNYLMQWGFGSAPILEEAAASRESSRAG